MYQLDCPPPQHNHLHLLSVPCCHGYRVKQHYCKAWAAELRLWSSTWLTDLSQMGCSNHDQKEEPFFKQLNKAMICSIIFVCTSVCHTKKHVHVSHNTPVCVFVYVSMSVYFCLSGYCFTCLRCVSTVFRGFLQAGTAAPWQWSNPPGRTAGTRKCVSHRPPASSTAASVHGVRRGSLGHRAFGSPSPPAPTPHGCSCLKEWRRESEEGSEKKDWIKKQHVWKKEN